MTEKKTTVAAPKPDAQEVATQTYPQRINVQLKGQILPSVATIHSPDDTQKKARGMVCMQMLEPKQVKSKMTGLSYLFPALKPVWVHPRDRDLCASFGAGSYRADIDK